MGSGEDGDRQEKECFVATVKLRPEKWQKRVIDRWFANATLFYNFLMERSVSEFRSMFENERFRNCWGYGWKFRKLGRLRSVESRLRSESEARDGLKKEDAEFLEELPSRIRELENDLAFVHDEYFPDVPVEKTYSAAYRDAVGFVSKWVINEREQSEFGYKPCTFSKFGFVGLAGCVLQNVPIDGRLLCGDGINSGVAQAIAERLWQAWDKKLAFENFGRRLFLHDKDSVVSSIKFKNNVGLKYDLKSREIEFRFRDGGEKRSFRVPFRVRRGDSYMEEVLSGMGGAPLHTSVVGLQMGPTVDYYAQMTVAGRPPEKGRRIGEGSVGVDLGPSSVTAVSGDSVAKWRLSVPASPEDETKIERLQTAMAEDDRRNNPDNYGEDGVPKKGAVNVHSRHYEKLRRRLSDIRRRLAARRRNEHGRIVNAMLPMGRDFVTENDDVKEWQERLDEPKGPNGSKSNYGRSVMSSAPAELMTRLETSLKRMGGTLRRIPCGVACTQFDHTDLSFTKRPVENRTVTLSDGRSFDRDAAAAFNIRHVSAGVGKPSRAKRAGIGKSPDNFDLEAMRRDYLAFVSAHEKWRGSSKWKKVVDMSAPRP